MMPDKIVPMRGAKTDAPITEDAVALALMHERGQDIRWCPERGAWYVWGGKRWLRERPGEVFEMARQVCRGFTAATGKEKWGAHKTVCSVERFARTQPELVAQADAWDADPMLLGTPGGTVDLRDGGFRPARRSERVTKSAAVDPAGDGASAPIWERFLDEVAGSDADLIRYLQRICGYALTGSVKEHALYFVYGPGGNGKGTFLDTVRGILGDYVQHAQVETFMGGSSGRHPADLAALHGARLVTSSETEEGEAWAEAKIKALTGGDPITARFMRENFFTFMPSFKLFIIGNHRPVLRNVDDAAKRRLRMIPFKIKPTFDDKELREKLRAEFPAILRWMIDGCLDWQAEDMPLPDVVRRETFDYFEDQDALGQWLTERCEIERATLPREQALRCSSSRLFASWAQWSSANGEKPGTNKSFSEALVRRGFEKKRGGSGVEFFRLRLKPGAGGQPYMPGEGS